MKFAIGIILALAASSAVANPTKNKEDCVQNTGEFAFIEPMLEKRVEGKRNRLAIISFFIYNCYLAIFHYIFNMQLIANRRQGAG